MKRTQTLPAYKQAAALGAAAIAMLGLGTATRAQTTVDGTNWGTLTVPVYGSSETSVAGGIYSAAELLTGPMKDADFRLMGRPSPYFDAVLPNGKIVTPAGQVAQIGMHPLGSALTPDGQYIVITCDDERGITGNHSVQPSPTAANNLAAGYTITVLRTSDLSVAAQTSYNAVGPLFVGIQVVSNGAGGYTIYASGGGSHNVKVLTFTPGTGLTIGTPIPIAPISPNGTPTNFAVANFTQNDYPENSGTSGGGIGSGIGFPSGTAGAPLTPQNTAQVGSNRLTFPAGSALSPSGRYLYVACNADNSLAVIDTTTNTVIKQIPVGFSPYAVTVSRDGSKVLVTNWGVQQYQFLAPTFDGSGNVTGLGGVTPGQNISGLFFVPITSTTGTNPQTSSVSVISVPGGDPTRAALLGSIYEGHPLDDRYNVGDTHPSAAAIVRHGLIEVEYVAKANSDGLGLILVNSNHRYADFDLSPLNLNLSNHVVHGTYPNALAVSPDNTRLYVAEAGLNSVAVLNVSNPLNPVLLGRIPTDWYPTALSVSADGSTLYIINDKGVGEDINANTTPNASGVVANNPTASGIESFSNSNSIFGTLQKVNLSSYTLDNTTVLANNFAVQNPANVDTSVVPIGGPASTKIRHVFFILHENKTFDSMLGNQTHFGNFASLTINNAAGVSSGTPQNTQTTIYNVLPAYTQFTSIAQNTQLLADTFATAVNYYSDAEESDAGHQFSASGTESDYTEKTLLVKGGRGLLANKNMEPEDYPEGGYIFNNAARNGVSFKDYGALIRVTGTDNGYAEPASVIDPPSGNAGIPVVPETSPVTEVTGSDVTSPTQGLGQSYYLKNPILAILGGSNANGEPHLDPNYPGYNFGISDQSRALEFNKDFDRMVAAGTLPTYLYIYQPNDHSGNPAATSNFPIYGGNTIPGTSPVQNDITGAGLIADGDTALGLVVRHIMSSPVYYNPADGTGSAIFMTYDDAQSGYDHLDPHRTPMIVISPYAKPAYAGKRHYSTASIVKTEELLMGLPPNNYGDLLATDLRDMFQSTYNGIALDSTGKTLINTLNGNAPLGTFIAHNYKATPEGLKVWKLSARLDSSSPDQDSYRLSMVTLLSMQADTLHREAARKGHLHATQYKATQARIYRMALRVVNGPKFGGGDGDDD
ncbi:MAG: hypothetical protein JO250_20990 [Armatimonadetes bacterium]|nr:hypothetical protein [Armatimonadota bacterium]